MLSLLLTPMVRRLAQRWRLVDQPDGARKTHMLAVPRLGGVAIAASYVTCYLLWRLTALRAAETVLESSVPFILKLLPVGMLVFGVGLLDDLKGLKPWQKLAGQAVAAVWAFLVGVRVTTLAGIEVHGILSFGLTVGWLLLCTNAFNLIDGMDGLAGGIGLLATATILISSLMQGNVALALATAPLVGCLVGFLRYNLPPASIFLGDSGSLLIGFLLGSYAVIWSQKCATLLGLAAPLMAFAVPLLEVVLSILRRFLHGRPIFGADRGHIHHMLLKRGLTTGKAVVILYAVAILAAVFSLTQSLMLNTGAGVVVILFCAFVWLGVQSLGYTEFRVASRMLRSGAFRGMISSEITIADLEDEILGAESLEECLSVVNRYAESQGFVGMVVKLEGLETDAVVRGITEGCWVLTLPLGGRDSLNLYHPQGVIAKSLAVASLVGLANGALAARLRVYRSAGQAARGTIETGEISWGGIASN